VVRSVRQAGDSDAERGGHPATLSPAPAGNLRGLRHGAYSANGRALEPRAREIAEAILDAPHTVDLDEIGAVEIGRLEALIESIDAEIAKRGVVNGRGQVRTLLEIRLRASKKLSSWLARFGMDPDQSRSARSGKLGSAAVHRATKSTRWETEGGLWQWAAPRYRESGARDSARPLGEGGTDL
jgi:hypothetical protein